MVKKLRMGQIMDSLWIVLICLALSGFMLYKMGQIGRASCRERV